MITQQAMDTYKTQRTDDDRNLVQEVRQILTDAGLGSQTIQFFDPHPIIQEAEHKVPDVQRWLLNRYWNLQLMASNIPSVNERFCLIPSGPLDEWVNLFRTVIVPFLKSHHLPIDITGNHHA